MSWREKAKPVSGTWREKANQYDAKTVQEMHPSISAQDRLIVKNLSNSPESATKYLQEKYPDMEIKFDQGQYKIRGAGESDYKVLDPDTGFFSSDFVSDTGDIVSDVGSAAVEGLGTAAGGVAGFFGGGGFGAVPGAMAGGAATSAGTEYLRQRLGQALGVNENVNAGDVGVAGVAGGISPLLFGADKLPGVKSAFKSGAKRFGKELTEEAYDQAARGGVKRVWDGTKNTVAPWIGEKVSGVGRGTIRSFANNIDEVDELSKSGIDEYTGQIYDKVQDYFRTTKDNAGKELVDAIENSGKKVSIKNAKQQYINAANKIIEDAGGELTNADQKKLKQLDKIFKENFGRVDADDFISDEIPAKRAWNIQKDLNQTAKWGQDMTPADVHTKGVARQSYFDINQGLDEASDGLTSTAKDRFRAAALAEEEILPKFSGKTRADSIQKTYNLLSGLDKQSKAVLKERLGKMADDGALDLSNESEILNAYRSFGKPKLTPVSSGGTTSTSRTIPLAIAGASLGSLAGYNSGGGYAGATLGGGAGALVGSALGSPAALKAIIKANRAAGRGFKNTAGRVPLYLRQGAGTEALKNSDTVEAISPYILMMNQQEQD